MDERRLTYLGGPHDGQITDWRGWRVHHPVPRRVGYVGPEEAARLPQTVSRTVVYEARQDSDGRWWYVLQTG